MVMVKQHSKVSCQWRRNQQGLPGERMEKFKTLSVQHVAGNRYVAELLRAAVACIAEEWETCLGEMHANLMHATGDRRDFHEGTGCGGRKEAVMGHRFFPPPDDGTDTVVAMTAR